MSKIEFSTISNNNDLNVMNDNFDLIAEALNGSVLYRGNPSGEPNTMGNDLDMNGEDILNADTVSARRLKLNGRYISPSTEFVDSEEVYIQSVAISNNTTVDDVSLLNAGTFTGQHYFYDLSDEITYKSLEGVSATVTSISAEVNGVVTLTDSGGGTHEIYNISVFEDGVVHSIAQLQLITPIKEGQVATLSLGGRSGQFVWTLGDFTTEVAVDTQQGIYIASASVAVTVGCWVRQIEGWDGTASPKVHTGWFGAVGSGSATASTDKLAFQCAFNLSTDIVVDPCITYYLLGGLTTQDKTTITGYRKWKYTCSDLASFTGLNGIAYDTSEATFIKFGKYCRFFHTSWFGNGKSVNFLPDSTCYAPYLFMTSIYGFSNGLGSLSTLGGVESLLCHFASNAQGITGLVDSKVSFCTINANTYDGIRITAGANDSTYTSNKIEWNGERGVNAYGNAASNQIIGGVIDRNGYGGLLVGGDAGLIVNATKFRRNGRLAELLPAQDAHIEMTGGDNPNFQLIGIDTAIGADDNGGNYLSPASVIACDNSPSTIGCISSSELTGSTANVVYTTGGGSLTVDRMIGCDVAGLVLKAGSGSLTINEAVGNKGYKNYGEVYDRINTGSYTGTDDTVFTVNAISTYSRASYQLDVVTRNVSAGYTYIQRTIIVARREGGDATAIELPVAATTSGNEPVITYAFSTDGGQLTVTLDSGVNTYSSNVTLTRLS